MSNKIIDHIISVDSVDIAFTYFSLIDRKAGKKEDSLSRQYSSCIRNLFGTDEMYQNTINFFIELPKTIERIAKEIKTQTSINIDTYSRGLQAGLSHFISENGNPAYSSAFIQRIFSLGYPPFIQIEGGIVTSQQTRKSYIRVPTKHGSNLCLYDKTSLLRPKRKEDEFPLNTAPLVARVRELC